MLLIGVCCTFNVQLNAQKDSHHIYLLGNTYLMNKAAPVLSVIDSSISASTTPAHIFYLGDLVSKNGVQQQPHPNDILNIRLLTNAFQKHKDVGLLFFSGDRDWDNSGKAGNKKVKHLEDYIEDELNYKKTFNPSKGCPGPKVIKINNYTTLIAINSQWFIHPHDRPEAPDTDCKILNEADFWDELEEEIEAAEGTNIIIAAHHPIYSHGRYAGKRRFRYHLLPIFGTFYNSFHKEIGGPADMANSRYQEYTYQMRSLLHNYSSILYVSAHEHDLQVIQEGRNYHINSGAISEVKPTGKSANTLYRQSKPGFIRLNLDDQGNVSASIFSIHRQHVVQTIPLFQSACSNDSLISLTNTTFNPCAKEQEQVKRMNPAFRDSSVTVIAGPEYVNTSFRRWAMGEHYRKEWKTPIEAPYLDLDRQYGGLRPFAKGGGLQTYSLKFIGGDGKEYAFRSINKDPVKALDEVSKETIYRHIVKDLITTQHPYGGLVADRLMDETDILHPKPLLFIMPDDPKLGIYQKEFANRLGTLELRPKGPKKSRKGIGGATDVKSSNKMFRSFYKNNFHRIDGKNYARARMFDFFVGDWDRHEDNWKWAAFKKGKRTTYRPIPRDRDHVFSQWEGLIPSIADKVVPNAEHFGKQFDNIQHLSFKARHLDRQLATELTEEDWRQAARYIQGHMTDQAITEAIATLPDEVEQLSGPEIKAKLIARRAQLEAAAVQLYQLLATQVDVVGSNKREVFEVLRYDAARLRVRMYDWDKDTGKAGKLLYERTFKGVETDEVRLYGLGGRDEFYVSGVAKENIMLRIIGGRGKDKIVDGSQAESRFKLTRVYDSESEDQVHLSSETIVLSPTRRPRYNNKAFEYNYFAPLPKFRISSGNGFGLEVMGTFYKRGFNKPDFAQSHQLKLIYYPSIKAQRLDWKSRFTEAVALHDIEIHLRLSSLYDKFPFFYGVGNKTERDLNRFEQDYYRTDFNTIQFGATLERRFLRKSMLKYGIRYEYNNILPIDEDFSIFSEAQHSDLNGRGKQILAGISTSFNLDFRDNPVFSTEGSQFFLDHVFLSNASRNYELFGRLEAFIAHYETLHWALPLTLALRGGASKTYGKTPFYYLSALGGNTYLRAHVRNRFLGDRSVFFNSELRLHIGNIRTPLVPIKWGVLGFWDAGRVWQEQEVRADGLHYGYGGGLYAAPFKEDFNFVIIIGESLDKELYFNISTGFDLQ